MRKRILAGLLALSLAGLSPGLEPYQALAAGPVSKGTPTASKSSAIRSVPRLARRAVASFQRIFLPGRGLSLETGELSAPLTTSPIAPLALSPNTAVPEFVSEEKGESLQKLAFDLETPAIRSNAQAGARRLDRAFDLADQGSRAENGAPSMDRVVAAPSLFLTPNGLMAFAPAKRGTSWMSRQINRIPVLDTSRLNERERVYRVGQTGFLFGVALYIPAAPILLSAMTGTTHQLGMMTMWFSAALAAGSLVAAQYIRRKPIIHTLAYGTAARGLIYGAGFGAALFTLDLAGSMTILQTALIAAGLVTAATQLRDIDSGTPTKIFSDGNGATAEEKVRSTIFYRATVRSVLATAIPPLVGLFVDSTDRLLGGFWGEGLYLGVLAATFAAVSRYWFKHKALFEDIPLEQPGGDGLRETLSAIGRVAKNKAILGSFLTIGFNSFIVAALFNVGLIQFVKDGLQTGNFGLGLLLAAVNGGALASGLLLHRYGAKLEKKHGGVKGLLDYLLRRASWIAAPLAAAYFSPSLGALMLAAFVIQVPFESVRNQLLHFLQKTIKEDPASRRYSDNINSLWRVLESVMHVIASLSAFWLFAHSGAGSWIYEALGPGGAILAMAGLLLFAPAAYWLVRRLIAQP